MASFKSPASADIIDLLIAASALTKSVEYHTAKTASKQAVAADIQTIQPVSPANDLRSLLFAVRPSSTRQAASVSLGCTVAFAASESVMFDTTCARAMKAKK